MIDRMQILLVDDSPTDAGLIRESLGEVKDFQFELTHANQLKAGLEYLSPDKPGNGPSFDVILLDLTSPVQQGLNSLISLRAATHLPIVVQSEIEDEELAVKVLQDGAQDFLNKGQISGARLERALKYAIERQRGKATQQRYVRGMEALFATSLEISAQLELQTVLHSIAEKAARLLGMPMGGLYLAAQDNQHVQLAAGYELPDTLIGTTLRIGEGLAGRVIETSKAFLVEDYQTWQDRPAIGELAEIRRALAVPLKSNQAVIGALEVLDNECAGPFEDEEVRLLTLFADQASNAVQNARLFESARQHARQMVLLNEIAQAAIRTPDFQLMLETAAARFSELIGAEGIYISLWDDLLQKTRLGAAHGFLKPLINSLVFEPGESTLTGAVLQEGYPIIIDKPDTSPYLSSRLAALFPQQTLLGLPLVVDGRKLGAVLAVFNSPTRLPWKRWYYASRQPTRSPWQ